MSTPALRRVLRRESHSPRTVAMVIAVALMILVLAYLGTGAKNRNTNPMTASTAPARTMIHPGRSVGSPIRKRACASGQMRFGDRAVLVDNGVIASSVARHLSEETGLSREDITVGVSHRRRGELVGVQLGLHDGLQRGFVQRDAEAGSEGDIDGAVGRVRVERPKQNEDEQ
jgi:cytochrome oxidase assembly protein ShyY1